MGFDQALDEWRRDLDDYVACGGGLLRVLSAPSGGGKTHLAQVLRGEAASRGFLTCQVDVAADHADDDLSLYTAFCAGLAVPRDPGHDVRGGLRSVLRYAADSIDEHELRAAVRAPDYPVRQLAEILPRIVGALRNGQDRRDLPGPLPEVEVALRLIAGELVDHTRSLGYLRLRYPGSLLKTLGRVPGKRDARLWLETLLRLLPKLGFPGVLWILDEHDQANPFVLDRHIVQLRRLADRLVEGRLPHVFAVYLVLDDFEGRIQSRHAALEQRVRRLLPGRVPRRVFAPLADSRDLDRTAFLGQVADRLHDMVVGLPMPQHIRSRCEEFARLATPLGGVDTRQFVKRVANLLLDEHA